MSNPSIDPKTINESSNDGNDHVFIEIKTPVQVPTIRQDSEMSSRYGLDKPRLTLQWNDLSYKVQVKNSKTKKMETKPILNQVSGQVKPGELLCIMGPSGAGKSSLLDALAGRNGDVTGSITVNGQKWNQEFKKMSSYVMQDDLFYPTITVREHLMFQAELRMGKTMTKEQYTERVNIVMEELGLNKCRDTFIGNERLRGISGGERKRLSFATEILTNPSLLFVDEPTSGLDSFMAETVVAQLRQLAADGRTIVATIHQPSSELYQLFDQLYLLSDGATVYSGKASEAVDYFSKLGYQCPSFVNPSDYFMRQLVVMDKDKDKEGVQRLDTLKESWNKNRPPNAQLTSDAHQHAGVVFDSGVGPVGQLRVLTKRNILRIVRDRMAFRAVLFQNLFIAIVVGLIYLQLEITQSGVQDIVGSLFFIAVNQMMATANAQFITVPAELPLITREYKNNLFYLNIWYFAKNISEIPMQIITPFFFFIPAYFLIGYGHGFDVYIQMQAFLILINSASVGIGYMVSCLAKRADIAPIIGIMMLLPFLLSGGLFLNVNNTPDYFVWLEYISPIKYGFAGLMQIFWRKVPSVPCNAPQCQYTTGTSVLNFFSLNSSTVLGDVWFNAVALIVINIFFRVVGFLALWLRIGHRK